MKKLIIVIIILCSIALGIDYYINNQNNKYNEYIKESYNYIYEANYITGNINYDIDKTWEYYTNNEEINRTELNKIVSLKPNEMYAEECNYIHTKKIDMVLGCITSSHYDIGTYELANSKLIKAKNYLKKIEDLGISSTKIDEMNRLYDASVYYYSLAKYYGEDYEEYKEYLDRIKRRIERIEEKYIDLYESRSNNSM